MLRSPLVTARLSLVFWGAMAGLVSVDAAAQTGPATRPPVRGRRYRLKVDSSPQHAAVSWAADITSPRNSPIAGYTPLTLEVPRGQIKILVDLPGFKPFEQTIEAKKNQHLSVTLERGAQVARLELQSSGAGTGADVIIDGTRRGTIPNSFELPAGRHQIEVKKSGYKTFSDGFDLADGERRTRDIVLERAEVPAGSLLVTSDAGGDVYVDGQRRAAAPAVISGVAVGDHVVEIRKEGLVPWRQIVTVPSGEEAKVAATFGTTAASSSLRAISNEPDVEVFIDGEDKGKAPVTVQSLKPGEHVVRGRKPAFAPFEHTVRVAAGENGIVSVWMEAIRPPPSGPTPEPVQPEERGQKEKRRMSSFGAKVNPPGGVTADFGIGYPYYFTARFTVGAFKVKPVGMDLGVELQTFLDIYDLDAHARLQLVEAGPLSIAARADVGAGRGRNGRSTTFVDAGGIASLAIGDVATFSATGRFSAWSDRFCPTATQESNGIAPEPFCHDPNQWGTLFGGEDPTATAFTGKRLYVGFEAVAALDRFTSLFIKIETLPLPDRLFEPRKPRLAFLDAYDSALFDKDPYVYGMAGVSLKF